MEKPSIKFKYYKYFPLKFLVEKIIQKRIKKIVNIFDKFINRNEKILDIGAGGGWISKEIQKRKDTKVTLLDITDFNQTDLRLILYDGERIPFSDNSFDVSFLIFVLHHAEKPLKVLKEAKRISKKRIIIIEDTFGSWFSKVLLCLWDILTNLVSFLVTPSGERMSFNFKKVSEWEEIFKNFNIKIIYKKEFRSFFIRHILFVVKPVAN